MLSAIASLALVAGLVAANPMPAASTTSECSSNYDGVFEIQVVNKTTTASKRSIVQVSFPFERSVDVAPTQLLPCKH